MCVFSQANKDKYVVSHQRKAWQQGAYSEMKMLAQYLCVYTYIFCMSCEVGWAINRIKNITESIHCTNFASNNVYTLLVYE